VLNSKPVAWKESGKPFLKEGHQINSAEILFPKIEDEMIEEQISKLGNTETPIEKKQNELISYDDFMKTKLKVAEILSAEKVVVVANLQPAKLMGEESNGMILAVDKEAGGLQVLIVDDSVKNGTRVK